MYFIDDMEENIIYKLWINFNGIVPSQVFMVSLLGAGDGELDEVSNYISVVHRDSGLQYAEF